jgi:hypothetical protein
VPIAAACSLMELPVKYSSQCGTYGVSSRNPLYTSVSLSVFGPAFLPAVSCDMGLYIQPMFSIGSRNNVKCLRNQLEKRRCEIRSYPSHLNAWHCAAVQC